MSTQSIADGARLADRQATMIVHSWRRSAAAGLERGDQRFHQVTAEELDQRLRQSSALIGIAQPHLDRIVGELPGTTNVAYLADADGIVLSSAGDAAQIVIFGLSPGYDWSENRMGTNGAGTALVTRKPVAVVGPDHFLTAFENCTCTAAPLFGPDGNVIGAIDVSSTVADAFPDRLSRVVEMASIIEAEFADRDAAPTPSPLGQ